MYLWRTPKWMVEAIRAMEDAKISLRFTFEDIGEKGGRTKPIAQRKEDSSMNFVAFIFIVLAGVCGVVELVQTRWRSLLGWAAVAVSTGILIDLCTSWSHTVHT